MKDIHSTIVTNIDATQKKPRILFECYLDNLTLTYVADRINVTFPNGGSTVYTALAIQLDDIEQTIEGQINRINVNFDNTMKYMGAYAASYDFEGRQLIIKRIYLDVSDNASSGSTIYNELFNGTFEAPKDVNRNWFQISATAGKPLRRKMLLKSYNRECSHVFGDINCNRDGNSDLSVLTLSSGVSGGANYMVYYKPDPAIAKPSSYWNYGAIDVSVSGVTYKRKVHQYNYNGTTAYLIFDVTLPVTANSSSIFQVKKGCDKTWNACGVSWAYGPLVDNTLNFFGYQQIGTKRETG